TNHATGAVVTNHFVDANGTIVNGARLIVVSATAPAVSPAIVKVRQFLDRTNIVDSDISPWLRLNESASVAKTRTDYEVLELSFDNGTGATFDARGFATQTRGDLTGTSGRAKGVTLVNQTKTTTATIAGKGYLPLASGASDTYTVLKGSLIATTPT